MDAADLRRLRGIFEAIDNENYKLALQLCNKALLKKTGPDATAAVKVNQTVAASFERIDSPPSLSLYLFLLSN